MRTANYQTGRERRLDVTMTPMIDVVFLLLIFFICTASFQLVEESLPSNLSTSGTSPAEAPMDPELDELEDVVIHVRVHNGQPEWTLNEQSFRQLDQIRDVLATLVRIQPGLPVILDVAGDVPLGQVIELYDLCRLLGYEQIQFSARV